MNTLLTRMLGAAALAATLAITLRPAMAAYPDRPVKILVGFPAGSTGDLIARILSPRLAEALRQPVIVENRTGAGSNIAAEAVVRSPADGYTLLLSTTANVINQSVSPGLKFNFLRDLVPVTLVGENPVLLVGPAATAPRSVAALVARAKALPGGMTYASSGNGTFTHLYGELFKQSAGVQITHVPYRGSTVAITDVLAGIVDLSFTPATPVMGHIQSGRLRALAVIAKRRMPALPDVPTFTELGIPGFESALWFGINAPAGTPAEVIERLDTELRAVLRQPEVRAQFEAQGIDAVGEGPARFGQLMARENLQWARIAKTAEIKAD